MFSSLALFFLLGVLGMAFNVGLTMLLHDILGVGVQISFAISIAVVFIFYYFANALIIFGGDISWNSFGKYTMAGLALRVVDFLLFSILISYTTVPYPLAIIIALAFSNSIKFIIYSRLVFRGKASWQQ